MRILIALLAASLASCATTQQSGSNEALRQAVAAQTSSADTPFKAGHADLNRDGVDDALVLLDGPEWCGTGGCTLLVFSRTPAGGYGFVSKSTVTRAPVRVATLGTGNWLDIIVNTKGAGDVVLVHAAEGYTANPSLASPASDAQVASATTLID